MDVKPLDWLLDTLAKAGTHLPEDDRAACARVADALRERTTGFSGPIRVVLVTGPDADWLTQELEWLAESIDEDRDHRRMIASQIETLRDELGERRKRITTERDRLHKVVEAVAAAPPYGVTAKMNSRYCTVCGAIEGAGDLHLQSCAWRMAREALGLDAEWPEPTTGA